MLSHDLNWTVPIEGNSSFLTSCNWCKLEPLHSSDNWSKYPPAKTTICLSLSNSFFLSPVCFIDFNNKAGNTRERCCFVRSLLSNYPTILGPFWRPHFSTLQLVHWITRVLQSLRRNLKKQKKQHLTHKFTNLKTGMCCVPAWSVFVSIFKQILGKGNMKYLFIGCLWGVYPLSIAFTTLWRKSKHRNLLGSWSAQHCSAQSG